MQRSIAAIVFDAYGTLFDVHSVIDLCDRKFPGRGDPLSRTWRSKQLEYTWLRSLMGRYEDFWEVTRAALAFACRSLGLDCTPAASQELMEAYLALSPFPEVKTALQRLSARKLAILSNGSPAMLSAVVKHAGLESVFATVLSVDEVKTYKPSPRVYELSPLRLGVLPSAIAFVSSNYWDITGAKSFGLWTCWVNRGALPGDELGVRPDITVNSLDGLTAHLSPAA